MAGISRCGRITFLHPVAAPEGGLFFADFALETRQHQYGCRALVLRRLDAGGQNAQKTAPVSWRWASPTSSNKVKPAVISVKGQDETRRWTV